METVTKSDRSNQVEVDNIDVTSIETVESVKSDISIVGHSEDFENHLFGDSEDEVTEADHQRLLLAISESRIIAKYSKKFTVEPNKLKEIIKPLRQTPTAKQASLFLNALENESFDSTSFSGQFLMDLIRILRALGISAPTSKTYLKADKVGFLNSHFFTLHKIQSTTIKASSHNPSSLINSRLSVNDSVELDLPNLNSQIPRSLLKNNSKTSYPITQKIAKLPPSPITASGITNPETLFKELENCYFGIVPFKLVNLIGTFIFNNSGFRDVNNLITQTLNSQTFESEKFSVVAFVYNIVTKQFEDNTRTYVSIDGKRFCTDNDVIKCRNVSHLWPSTTTNNRVSVKFESSKRTNLDSSVAFIYLVKGLSYDEQILSFYLYEISKLNNENPTLPVPTLSTVTELYLNTFNIANTVTIGTKRKHPDDEVEIGDAKVSLHCPLSRKRISYPVKGLNCGDHLQCTDLESILISSKSNTVFKCGHCNKPMTVIKIDIKMHRLLKKYINEEFCVVKSDGTDEKFESNEIGSNGGAIDADIPGDVFDVEEIWDEQSKIIDVETLDIPESATIVVYDVENMEIPAKIIEEMGVYYISD